PQRFRLNSVGDNWLADSHRDLAGRFLDEIEPGAPPLAFLLSQCAATVESGKPTWHARHAPERASATQPAFERLLLPLWGDGRISMIFGAIDRQRTASGARGHQQEEAMPPAVTLTTNPALDVTAGTDRI